MPICLISYMEQKNYTEQNIKTPLSLWYWKNQIILVHLSKFQEKNRTDSAHDTGKIKLYTHTSVFKTKESIHRKKKWANYMPNHNNT